MVPGGRLRPPVESLALSHSGIPSTNPQRFVHTRTHGVAPDIREVMEVATGERIDRPTLPATRLLGSVAAGVSTCG